MVQVVHELILTTWAYFRGGVSVTTHNKNQERFLAALGMTASCYEGHRKSPSTSLDNCAKQTDSINGEKPGKMEVLAVTCFLTGMDQRMGLKE
jgi:predicted lipoprotein with Yx(FWY)xxD motif